MDRLEPRNLPSVTFAVCTGDPETVHNLVITSDEAADVILVQPQDDGGSVLVTVNGVATSYVGIESVAVYGNDGDDVITLRGEDIDYFADGGFGNDSIFGSAGDDWLQDEWGDDIFVGGGGADYLAGGPGNDTLYGGPGDDVLIGEAGVDEMYGGTGWDRAFADAEDMVKFAEEIF